MTAARKINGTPEQVEECLRAFVIAYGNGERLSEDLMQVEIFKVWLRACDLLNMLALRDDRPPLKTLKGDDRR